MTTYAIRSLSAGEGNRIYYHEDWPHWRSTPPLPEHRLSLKETRRLARTIGGRVVCFTTYRDRALKLMEAAHTVWMSCQHGRMGLSGHFLESVLVPFLCGSQPNSGISAGLVSCHNDDGPTVCPCILLKDHKPPCRCEHGTDW